jgi:hypothetical protein
VRRGVVGGDSERAQAGMRGRTEGSVGVPSCSAHKVRVCVSRKKARRNGKVRGVGPCLSAGQAAQVAAGEPQAAGGRAGGRARQPRGFRPRRASICISAVFGRFSTVPAAFFRAGDEYRRHGFMCLSTHQYSGRSSAYEILG